MVLSPATVTPVEPAESSRDGALAASAAIICLNEAACIGKCLQSLRDFAEIIVVDSGSTDGTLAIVDEFMRRGFPVRLVNQPWLGYAAAEAVRPRCGSAAMDLQHRRRRVARR